VTTFMFSPVPAALRRALALKRWTNQSGTDEVFRTESLVVVRMVLRRNNRNTTIPVRVMGGDKGVVCLLYTLQDLEQFLREEDERGTGTPARARRVKRKGN